MITSEQCRAARAWLDISQEELAERASVSLSTVRDFEKERRVPIPNNLAAIERVLAEAGITLTSESDDVIGIRAQRRTHEYELYIPILDILDNTMEGFMKTTDLINTLQLKFQPSGEDSMILEGRSDTKFSQIVRNVVSHRDTETNPIHKGWMEYDRGRRGLKITPSGRMVLLEHEKKRSGL